VTNDPCSSTLGCLLVPLAIGFGIASLFGYGPSSVVVFALIVGLAGLWTVFLSGLLVWTWRDSKAVFRSENQVRLKPDAADLLQGPEPADWVPSRPRSAELQAHALALAAVPAEVWAQAFSALRRHTRRRLWRFLLLPTAILALVFLQEPIAAAASLPEASERLLLTAELLGLSVVVLRSVALLFQGPWIMVCAIVGRHQGGPSGEQGAGTSDLVALLSGQAVPKLLVRVYAQLVISPSGVLYREPSPRGPRELPSEKKLFRQLEESGTAAVLIARTGRAVMTLEDFTQGSGVHSQA
jgi:hypothetical protein